MLFEATVEVIYPFAVLFIVCEMAHRYIRANDEIGELVEQFEWYLFPVEIQRMMPSILNFTQQSNEIICFGSTACNRETFKYVSNKPKRTKERIDRNNDSIYAKRISGN